MQEKDRTAIEDHPSCDCSERPKQQPGACVPTYLLCLWLLAKGLGLLVKLPSRLPKGVRSFLYTSLLSIPSGRKVAGKTGHPDWVMGKWADL